MFTLQLNAGLASKYLITDIKKNVGISEKPRLVSLSKILTVNILVEILTNIYNINLPSGLFGMGAKKLDSRQVALFLEDLCNQRKPSGPIIEIREPVFILAGGFDKKALIAIKILRLRGLCPIMAVDISALGGDIIVKIDSELINNKIEEAVSYKIYRPDTKLCVVSGINKTVLSTENNAAQILKKFPGLISSIDLESVNEPLFE